VPADFSRREALLAGAGSLLAASPATRRKPAPARNAKPAAPIAPPPERPFARVELQIAELLARSRTPGLSIAIVQRNQVVYANGFGLANVAANKPVGPETVFQAASLTKPVFSYAALKLCESGRMGLDTPLSSYIAHARISRDPRAHRITPRMVLAHMSGLPNWANGKRPLKMDFDPGAHFGYSGEAFNVLQEAVEKQSEQPLDELLTETVAMPFGLAESKFTWTDAFESTAAVGYEWDGTPVKSRSKPTEAMAASSLHTTARDYAKFMIVSLAQEQRAPEHLDYASERMMLSPQTRLAGPLAWGLGWALLLRDDGDIHWHFGDSRGYMSYAAMSRATGDGVVIFANGRHGLRVCHAVAKELLDNQDAIFSWIYDVFYEGKLPQWQSA
jgi:CubicO group peptidase (beta-lactamase class C family)